MIPKTTRANIKAIATKPPMSVKEPSIPAKPIIIISAKIAQIIEYIPLGC